MIYGHNKGHGRKGAAARMQGPGHDHNTRSRDETLQDAVREQAHVKCKLTITETGTIYVRAENLRDYLLAKQALEKLRPFSEIEKLPFAPLR